jgi:8-oxo-dGTP pyrophosphatase MutT (NUDIX family)
VKFNKSIPLFHGVYRTPPSGAEKPVPKIEVPDAADLKSIWDSHWRPNVVLCITRGERLLLCFSAEHNLWQLPQGGVEPGETLEEALTRELSEEIGFEFASACCLPSRFIGRDRIEFPSPTTVTSRPSDRAAEQIAIRGKVYFFSHLAAGEIDVSLSHSQFDDCKWCNYQEAYDIFDALCQSGKRRVSLNALSLLKRFGLVA